MQLVLDTNVVLDLLVFRDPRTTGIAAALQANTLHWLATAEMRDELAHVLAYPKLGVRVARERGSPQAVLADFDAAARVVPVAPKAGVICRDPDDQKFIDLAVQHRCTLLSKDRDVLKLRKRLARLEVAAIPQWPAA